MRLYFELPMALHSSLPHNDEAFQMYSLLSSPEVSASLVLQS